MDAYNKALTPFDHRTFSIPVGESNSPKRKAPWNSRGFSFMCGPEGSRTPNLLIRSQMLYPIKLQNQTFLCKEGANIEI